VEGILRDDTAMTMLVNNAGFGSVTPLLKNDVGQMEDMIALNVIALTRLSYAARRPLTPGERARSSTSPP
jgi:short-subunit dehydrogenase